jgi:hypothetical protein
MIALTAARLFYSIARRGSVKYLEQLDVSPVHRWGALHARGSGASPTANRIAHFTDQVGFVTA